LNSLLGTLFIIQSFLFFDYKGIHEVEWKIHQGEVFTIPSPEGVTYRKERKRELRKDVYGYYPYWMGTAYNNLQYDLLSHIAYFSVELHGDGSLGAIPNLSLLQNLRNVAHSHGVSVLITATQFDDIIITSLLNSAAARSNAVTNLLNLALTHSLDGISIDFEFPDNTVKDSLTVFMTELTDTFHAHIPVAHVSIATPAVDWGNAFDYDELALHTDGLFIMAYNYYWSGSSYAGPVSPLLSSTLWGTYSVMWTINNYIQYGIYRDKFILGCPYYGLRWPTENDSIKSPTRGAGGALTYTRAADSAAVYGKLWDDTSKTVWYKNYIPGDGWYQSWFDDSLSLRMKYQVLIDSNLCGAGIWALGYDGTKIELWDALRDAFYYTGIKEIARNKCTILKVYPNPFREKTVIEFGSSGVLELNSQLSNFPTLQLTIYDVSGREVRQFLLSPFDFSLSTTVEWDGKDNDGKLLPSGIYFCTFTSGENKKTQKVHFIR